MAITATHIIENLAFNIRSGEFNINSDVSEKLGGHNTAPDPHQLLEASLAACTAITVQMYAKRKNIPLAYSDVKITITAEGASNEILREIHFVGEALTDADKQALMVIADKCPIHKFLTAGAKINSKLI